VIWVTGNAVINSSTRISGTLVVEGTLTLGTNNIASSTEIRYDEEAHDAVGALMGRYFEDRSTIPVSPRS
jgi:hypothetical protein